VTTGEWLPSLCASRSEWRAGTARDVPRTLFPERSSRKEPVRSNRILHATASPVPYRPHRARRPSRERERRIGVIQCVVIIGIHRLWAIAAPVLRCCQYVNVSVGPKRKGFASALRLLFDRGRGASGRGAGCGLVSGLGSRRRRVSRRSASPSVSVDRELPRFGYLIRFFGYRCAATGYDICISLFTLVLTLVALARRSSTLGTLHRSSSGPRGPRTGAARVAGSGSGRAPSAGERCGRGDCGVARCRYTVDG